MKKIIYTIITGAALLAGASSCSLDQYPHTSDTAANVYTSTEGYQSVLSGIYAAMIQRISSVSDEERSQNYIRTLMMFQDCSTDACDAIWLSGESLTDVNGLSWNASDSWCSAMYYHIYNIVAMSNELIRNASDSDLLSSFNDSERAQIEKYRNEARFLRAYAYTQAIDFYNKMPFVTEEDGSAAICYFVSAGQRTYWQRLAEDDLRHETYQNQYLTIVNAYTFYVNYDKIRITAPEGLYETQSAG